jgi:O-acetyl-ADP-ribose deacetylase (regulator of RNase III)
VTVRIDVVRGDITAETLDAIVNAANSSLLGGGGVDGAIHAGAGPDLLELCRQLRRERFPAGLPTGDAVATPAGRLPCRHVIHTVGPQWDEHGAGGAALLASCHTRSLEVADELGDASIAFPAISCGAYGWTPQRAAPVAMTAVHAYAAAHPASGVTLVRFVLSSAEAQRCFEEARSALE